MWKTIEEAAPTLAHHIEAKEERDKLVIEARKVSTE